MPAPEPLTVLTANLFNDRAHSPAFNEIIVRARPDVVAAQELGPETARVLEQHFPYGFLRPQTDYNGMGLAASFEVDTDEIDTPDPRAITALLRPGTWETLRLLCVRIPPPLSAAWLRARRDYVLALLEVVDAHSGPLCLLGDLNATPAWPSYRMLTRTIEDGFRQARQSILLRGATWPAMLPLLRIDHVFVRGLRVHKVRRLSIRGTDHKGLLAEITR